MSTNHIIRKIIFNKRWQLDGIVTGFFYFNPTKNSKSENPGILLTPRGKWIFIFSTHFFIFFRLSFIYFVIFRNLGIFENCEIYENLWELKKLKPIFEDTWSLIISLGWFRPITDEQTSYAALCWHQASCGHFSAFWKCNIKPDGL